MTLIIRADKNAWQDKIELRLLQCADHGQIVGFVESLTVRSVEGDQYIPACTYINGAAAQQLMDDLWRGGIRPSEGSGSAGQLAATERHLADMKAIAFAKLGIKQ